MTWTSLLDVAGAVSLLLGSFLCLAGAVGLHPLPRHALAAARRDQAADPRPHPHPHRSRPDAAHVGGRHDPRPARRDPVLHLARVGAPRRSGRLPQPPRRHRRRLEVDELSDALDRVGRGPTRTDADRGHTAYAPTGLTSSRLELLRSGRDTDRKWHEARPRRTYDEPSDLAAPRRPRHARPDEPDGIPPVGRQRPAAHPRRSPSPSASCGSSARRSSPPRWARPSTRASSAATRGLARAVVRHPHRARRPQRPVRRDASQVRRRQLDAGRVPLGPAHRPQGRRHRRGPDPHRPDR